jgi:hypothetical protein
MKSLETISTAPRTPIPAPTRADSDGDCIDNLFYLIALQSDIDTKMPERLCFKYRVVVASGRSVICPIAFIDSVAEFQSM